MKFVTRIELDTTHYTFSGPKTRRLFRVDMFAGGISSSELLDKRSLEELYLNSRDAIPGSEHKFTGPAHSAMSELVFKDQPLVIRLSSMKCNRYKEKVRGESKYLLGAYYNGRYYDSVMKSREFEYWMSVNKDRAIIFCSPSKTLH